MLSAISKLKNHQSGQMLTQSLAAGISVNSQWFTPLTATGDILTSNHNDQEWIQDSAGCESEASTASVQSGWPLSSSSSDASSSSSICWRRRRLLLGGSWSSWTFIRGSMIQGFVPGTRTLPSQPAAEPEKLTS